MFRTKTFYLEDWLGGNGLWVTFCKHEMFPVLSICKSERPMNVYSREICNIIKSGRYNNVTRNKMLNQFIQFMTD